MAQKKLLRTECLVKRQEFLRNKKADVVVPQILNFLADKKGNWGGFMPLPTEPDIRAIYSRTSGVTWAYPYVDGEDLKFLVPSREGQFVKSKLGVLEPDLNTSIEIDASKLNGILIPGAAFDTYGFRLGLGRGFYDRFLKTFSGKKVGVCFSVQLLPQIPHEDHDQKMDVILTEEKILHVSA